MTSVYRFDLIGFYRRVLDAYTHSKPCLQLQYRRANAIGQKTTSGAPTSIQKLCLPNLSDATIASPIQSAESAALTRTKSNVPGVKGSIVHRVETASTASINDPSKNRPNCVTCSFYSNGQKRIHTSDRRSLTGASLAAETDESRDEESRLKAGCSQDWLPHKRPIDNRPQVGNLPHKTRCTQPRLSFLRTSGTISKAGRRTCPPHAP
jgi:hypothetical protein